MKTAKALQRLKPGAQLALGIRLKQRWGGKRRGAGRKPRGPKPRVSHGRRPRFNGQRTPIHVTWPIVPGAPNLRDSPAKWILWNALGKACDRFGTRITAYCFQENHIHMIVESFSAEALGKAMQGLGVRIAKNVNKAVGRRGSLFADHYHGRLINNPTQMLRTIVYVLNNRRHHLAEFGRSMPAGWTDPCSSARSFLGWREGPLIEPWQPYPDPVMPPRTWLLREGWKKAGVPSINDVPGGHD